MAIVKPLLPPLDGYVEVEVNGVRTYRNAKTGILIEDELPEEHKDVYDEMAAAITEGVNEV